MNQRVQPTSTSAFGSAVVSHLVRCIPAALAVAAVALLCGCDTFRGPGIDYTAPRVTGRVVDDSNGAPVKYARVGRQVWKWRGSTGEFLKGGEELMLSQDFQRTGRDGSFQLPAKQVALLFGWGEVPLNLRLTVQHGAFVPWQTNYPIAALSTNSEHLELNAGDIRVKPRSR
jgi:hypothetical protein